MLDERLVYLAAVLNVAGTTTYVIATVRGRTKPNRVTWFVWTIVPLVAFGAELDEGVGTQAAMTLSFALGPALILLASFVNSNANWQLTRLDLMCGALSLIAIGAWLATGHGTIAIALAIAADALAALPTLIKSYRHPRTESPWTYWVAAACSVITLLTINTWNLAHYGFPLYAFTICALIASLITFRISDAHCANAEVSQQPVISLGRQDQIVPRTRRQAS